MVLENLAVSADLDAIIEAVKAPPGLDIPKWPHAVGELKFRST